MIKVSALLLFIFSYFISFSQLLNNGDLTLISNSIKDKKIIGLGEPDHFYTGYYEVKIQIIKHLISQNKIDVIALEASTVECRKLDAYIKGSEEDLYKILPDLNAGYKYEKEGIFDCRQIVQFLQWLQKENKNRTNKISIYGIDFQSIETPIENLKTHFPNSIPLHEKLDTIRNNFYSFLQQFIDDRLKMYFDSAWKTKTANNYEVSEWILNYVNAQDSSKWIRQNARELNQFSYMLIDPNIDRDKIMYENFMSQYDPEKTTLLWAADFHIGNDSLVNKNWKILLLGAYLNKEFGKQYFKIALIRDENPQLSERMIYPISPYSKLFSKYDFLIKTNPGPKAIRLEDQEN